MNKLYYCNKCIDNNIIKEIKQTEKSQKTSITISKSGVVTPTAPKMITVIIGFINNGFVGYYRDNQSNSCPHCGNPTIELSLTIDEWEILKQVSTDSNFILAMDKLKQDDVIEFNLKLTQFKSQPQQQESAPQPAPNIPKCPTCGSTDVKKISGTKRWVGTGLFGLASSDLGKTMKCNNCGYKW